jgi:bifunctional DNA-binding transcriptional regulator/antitoxin component of YhaV-PrlF toxin-antitoxin module
MKLQKQLSRKVDDKEYPKYVVTIPPKCIQTAGWEEGIELDFSVNNNELVLRPKKTKAPSVDKT